MGQISFSVVAACKTIQCLAGFYHDFMLRQFLIQRIFYHDLSVFDCSFPFHSFPVLSFVLSREQAQQMSTHLPFLACWEFPKPFYFPLTTTTAAISRLGNSCPHFLSRPKNGFCCILPLTYTTRNFSFLQNKKPQKFCDTVGRSGFFNQKYHEK